MIDFSKLAKVVSLPGNRVATFDDDVAFDFFGCRQYVFTGDPDRGKALMKEGGYRVYGAGSDEVHLPGGSMDVVLSTSLEGRAHFAVAPGGWFVLALEAADFDPKTPDDVEDLIPALEERGLEPALLYRADGHTFLVARKIWTGTTTLFTFERDPRAVFYGPILDEAMGVVPRVGRKGIRHDLEPVEKRIPAWKVEALLEMEEGEPLDEEVRRELKSRVRPFKGGTIMMPSPQQAAILVASGRFDKEIELDGEKWILKGSQTVEHEEKPRLNPLGECTAIRRIHRKKGAVIGLNLDRGYYCVFS